MMKSTYCLPLVGMFAVSLAGCEGADPNTYDLSVPEMRAKLIGKQSSYKSGTQTRFMVAERPTTEGFKARMWNDVSWKKSCDVFLVPVEEKKTRVEPKCGEAINAAGETSLEFVHSEIRAHVRQILTGEPVDRKKLMLRATAVTAKNMPAMQKEALEADMSMKMEQLADKHRAQQDGWGSDASVDPDAGWGEP